MAALELSPVSTVSPAVTWSPVRAVAAVVEPDFVTWAVPMKSVRLAVPWAAAPGLGWKARNTKKAISARSNRRTTAAATRRRGVASTSPSSRDRAEEYYGTGGLNFGAGQARTLWADDDRARVAGREAGRRSLQRVAAGRCRRADLGGDVVASGADRHRARHGHDARGRGQHRDRDRDRVDGVVAVATVGRDLVDGDVLDRVTHLLRAAHAEAEAGRSRVQSHLARGPAGGRGRH